MNVSIVWITPNAEQVIIDTARVSSMKRPGEPGRKLLAYLMDNEHWSPFEMASLCLEINTTRDIGRQLLRHRSFSFQEFSQRYADASNLGKMILRECRMQDKIDRQKSVPCTDPRVAIWWQEAEFKVRDLVSDLYAKALEKGIAKEVARTILPEGMTPSKLYMTGTMRSWLTYLGARWRHSQPEHMAIADEVATILSEHIPTTFHAYIRTKDNA